MEKHRSLTTSFIEAPRQVKRLLAFIFDISAIFFSIFVALGASNNKYSLLGSSLYTDFSITVFLSIFIFIRFGFYRAIFRYMGLAAVFTMVMGTALSTVVFSIVSFFLVSNVNWITVVLYASVCLFSIGASRLVIIALIRSKYKQTRLPISIYGAGFSGRELARALSQSNRYKVCAFIDDNPMLYRTEIDGIRVYPPATIKKIISKFDITRILLAMPSETHARRSEILSYLEHFPVKIKTIASMEEIVNGKIQIEQLKEIEIEDLLGRDLVEPDKNLLESCITNKSVMVTGAGGSIGSELCRQIMELKPQVLILYEISEFALYSIERELRKILQTSNESLKIIPLLGSVLNKDRLILCMQKYKVNTIYHAAAYKHVPMVEQNMLEGIRNNIFGTWIAAEAAEKAGVNRFVLISTDKAVRPTNVMGASKRCAELVLQAMNIRGTETFFTMVRFGNVLGSSGSVVPLFREQIKSGGPLTVTHKDIIRYFMTIPEAAQLVIQAGAMGKGGDVFVLDMGEQVKISELAEKMVHLLGLTVKNNKNPLGDIEINYSGLRPGEKLYEELLIGDNVEGTIHPKIMTADEDSISWEDMFRALNTMDELCEKMNCEGIVKLLLEMPTGYNPQHAFCDLLWDENRPTVTGSHKVVRLKSLAE